MISEKVITLIDRFENSTINGVADHKAKKNLIDHMQRLESNNAEMFKYLIKHAKVEISETDGISEELELLLRKNKGKPIEEVLSDERN